MFVTTKYIETLACRPTSKQRGHGVNISLLHNHAVFTEIKTERI